MGGEEHDCLPRKRIETTKKHQKARRVVLFGALWRFDTHLSLYQSRKSTKKHLKAPLLRGGGHVCLQDKRTKKKDNDKEPKSTKKHEGSCFLVHYGASSSTQAYTNHEKGPKSTEKHQKAQILKEGEPAPLSHTQT